MRISDIPAGKYNWFVYEGRSDYRNRCVDCGSGLVSGEDEMLSIATECAWENGLGAYEGEDRININQGLVVQFELGHVVVGR